MFLQFGEEVRDLIKKGQSKLGEVLSKGAFAEEEFQKKENLAEELTISEESLTKLREVLDLF